MLLADLRGVLALDARRSASLLSRLPCTTDPGQANTVLVAAEVPMGSPLTSTPHLLGLTFKPVPLAAPLVVLNAAPSCIRLHCIHDHTRPDMPSELHTVQQQSQMQPADTQSLQTATTAHSDGTRIPFHDADVPGLAARLSIGSSTGTGQPVPAGMQQQQQPHSPLVQQQSQSAGPWQEALRLATAELGEHLDCAGLYLQLLQRKIKGAQGRLGVWQEAGTSSVLQDTSVDSAVLSKRHQDALKFANVAHGLKCLLDELS